MDSEVLEECFQLALKLAKEAGEIILEGMSNRKKQFSLKDNVFHDLVTEYDTKVEKLLMDGIREKFPDHKFLSEEDNAATKVKPSLTPNCPTWIIDPIDGTNNFIHGIPYACVSIALVFNSEILLGIVNNPKTNELFTAKKNCGAYLNGEKIHTSSADALNKSLIANELSLAALNVNTKELMGRAERFGTAAIGLRSFGTAALTLSYIACGKLDGYVIDNLYPWDIAAGALLVREAGGTVIGINGLEYDILKPDVIAASTEDFIIIV
uniref:Inositol-1-monophosphatase n=1 Tax=Corethrella appendiculata TaxID=1370023 RepID=U5ETD7_9DIPT